MSSKPDVSIIIPCYNAAQTLETTIASVRAQTHEGWQAVCVDDASTDETPALLRALSANDRRIEHMRVPHGGLAASRNRALPLARADHLLFLDADDLLRPDALELLLRASREGGGRAVVAGGVELLDESATPLGLFRFPGAGQFTVDALLRSNRLTSTSLVPAAVLTTESPFDQTVSPCEDWDLWLRLAHAGTACLTVPRVVFGYRLRAGSLSHKADLMYRAGRRVLERWLPHATDAHAVRDVLHRWAWACGAQAEAARAPGAMRRYFADLPPFVPTDDLALSVASDIHWSYLFAYGAKGKTWRKHGATWLPEIRRWLQRSPLSAQTDAILVALTPLAGDAQDWTATVHAFVQEHAAARRLVVYGLGTNGVSLLEGLRGSGADDHPKLLIADDRAPQSTFTSLALPREDPRQWRTWPDDTLVVLTPNECDAMRRTLLNADGREGHDFIRLVRTTPADAVPDTRAAEVSFGAAHAAR